MFASAETTFGPGLYRVDVESGNVSQIIASQPPGLMPLTNGQYSPDGRRLYQLRVPENALVEVDLSSGKETKLKVEIAEHPFRRLAVNIAKKFAICFKNVPRWPLIAKLTADS
jgi:hypothetical protein